MAKHRKAWELIQLLSTSEKVAFTDWLGLELSGKQKRILDLFHLFNDNASPEEMWDALSLGDGKTIKDPFTDSNFRKLEFQLNSHIEEFLAIQAFREDTPTLDLYIIKGLNQRESTYAFESKLRKILLKLDKQPIRDESYFWYQYLLERENQHYLSKHPTKGKGGIAPRISQAFDDWMLHEKLRIAINNLNHAKIFGEIIQSPFLEETLAKVETLAPEQYPILHLYARIFQATRSGEEEEENLEQLLFDYQSLLQRDNLKDFFAIILNYYARKMPSDKSNKYLRKLYRLYQWSLQEKLIFKDGVLSWDHYKNLITIGLRLKEYDLTLEYIEKYKSAIAEEQRETAYRFNLAHYYFTQREFDRVIKLLNLRFSNVYYEIQARLLILQARYELNHEDLGRDLRSLRVFIKRQKNISPSRKDAEINRIKFFERLVRAFSRSDYQELIEQISTSQAVSNRQWLLEKALQKI